MIAVGDPLAPFTLPDVDGVPVRWAPGEATVVCVVAFWCDTWREQLARLERVRRASAGTAARFLVVAVDGRWVERGASQRAGRLLRDPDGRWSRGLGIRAVPFTVVADAAGVVRLARQGIARTDDLQAALEPSPGPVGSVWLTFDDFPQAGDDLLLDLLRRTATPATFFCLGARLGSAEGDAVARRALAEGHALQVHAWDHDPRRPQVARCVAALAARGARPTLHRPPGSSALWRIGGGRLALATLTPGDDLRPGEDELARRLSALRPGMVAQLHAGVGQTRAVLEGTIGRGRRARWRFATLV